MRWILLPAAALVAGCGNATELFFEEERDEPLVVVEQPDLGSPHYVFAIGGSYEQKFAQVVTAPVAGELVDVWLAVNATTTLVLAIESVGADGKPDGNVLTTQSYDEVDGNYATMELLRFRLDERVPVMPGERFAIAVLDGDGGMAPGPEGNPYAGGNAFFEALPNPPGWVAMSETSEIDDYPFRASFAE